MQSGDKKTGIVYSKPMPASRKMIQPNGQQPDNRPKQPAQKQTDQKQSDQKPTVQNQSDQKQTVQNQSEQQPTNQEQSDQKPPVDQLISDITASCALSIRQHLYQVDNIARAFDEKAAAQRTDLSNKLNEAIDKLNSTQDELTMTKEKLDAEKDDHKATQKRAAEAEASLKDSLANVGAELDKTKEKLACETRTGQATADRLEKTKKSLEESRKEVAQMAEDAKKAKKQIEESNKKVTSLTGEVAEAKKSTIVAQKKVNELEGNKKGLTAEVARLKEVSDLYSELYQLVNNSNLRTLTEWMEAHPDPTLAGNTPAKRPKISPKREETTPTPSAVSPSWTTGKGTKRSTPM